MRVDLLALWRRAAFFRRQSALYSQHRRKTRDQSGQHGITVTRRNVTGRDRGQQVLHAHYQIDIFCTVKTRASHMRCGLKVPLSMRRCPA